MPKRKNKLDRQRISRQKLADSIFRTTIEIEKIEPQVKLRHPVFEYDKLMTLHYKLAQNLHEYIQVNNRIKEEEQKLQGIFKKLTQ